MTAVTVKIVPYQPYLRLTYHPCYSLRETMEVLEIETNKDSGNDSVEGIAFSRDTAVIMTGQFVDLDEVIFKLLFLSSDCNHWPKTRS